MDEYLKIILEFNEKLDKNVNILRKIEEVLVISSGLHVDYGNSKVDAEAMPKRTDWDVKILKGPLSFKYICLYVSHHVSSDGPRFY